MNMKQTKEIVLLCFVLVTIGCTDNSLGGAEAGNPNRTVTGEVANEETSSSLSLVKNQTTDPCPADRVIAVNSRRENAITQINSHCSF